MTSERRNEDRRRTDATVEQLKEQERSTSEQDAAPADQDAAPASDPPQASDEIVNDALIEDRFEASDN